MNYGHLAALHLQAARGFESQQSAADDDGLRARLGRSRMRARVVEIAEREDVLLVEIADRREEGAAARSQQQPVVLL